MGQSSFLSTVPQCSRGMGGSAALGEELVLKSEGHGFKSLLRVTLLL